MIKYIIFALIGLITLLVQWLCMTEINGVRAIYNWPSFAAFMALWNNSFESQSDKIQLAIAVISRMEHFDQRNAIRSTWKKLVEESTAFFFVVPEHPCPIDPEWRMTDKECIPWQVQVLPNINVIEQASSNKPYRIKNAGSSRPSMYRDGLAFKVKFPVAVHQLGLAKKALEGLDLNASISVELVDTASKDILLVANFSHEDLALIPSDDGFIYKKTQEESLLKGFEGLLRISGESWSQVDKSKMICSIDWNKVFGEDGPIIWTASYADQNAKPSSQNFCPLATLIYNIPDILELKQIVVASDTHNRCQENRNKNIQSKLVEEMEDNEDDIFLAPDLTDSDSGSAKALLPYLTWLLSPHSPLPNFDFVLVTDDTSFVAIDKLNSRLLKTIGSTDFNCNQPGLLCANQGGTLKLWRSQFQYNKPSDPSYHYFAPFLPPTPSQAGSVISRDLAIYLTHNFNYFLHGFANIANSLAIWLAPLAPSYYDEQDWFNSFDNIQNASKALAIGQIPNGLVMQQIYKNYVQCGKVQDCML